MEKNTVMPCDQIIGLVFNSIYTRGSSSSSGVPCVNLKLRTLLGALPIRGMVNTNSSEMEMDVVSILPKGCRAVIHRSRWPVHPAIRGDEPTNDAEMRVDIIIIVPGWEAGEVAQQLEWCLAAQEGDRSLGATGKHAFQIGDVKQGARGVEIV